MKRLIYSPLFVWVLLLITLVISLIVLTRIDAVRVHVKERQKELPKKIEKAKHTKREVDMVFFGNSLMQSAIPPREEEISRIISQSVPESAGEKRNLGIVNLAIDGRTSWDIEHRADQILGLNPKLIILQTEMIIGRNVNLDARAEPGFMDKEKEQLKNWIRYARSPFLKRYLGDSTAGRKKKELLDALSSPAQVDIKILKHAEDIKANEQYTLEQRNLQKARERWSEQTISLKSPEYKIAREFIRKARQKGIRVLVVETPVSETAAQFATEKYLSDRRAVIVSLLDGDQRWYLSYPKLMPDKYFADYTHTNRKGKKVFFSWLAPMLAERLNGDN